MSDTDHLYIDRPTIKLLLKLLHRIPALAEDLAITEMKQARTSKPDATGFRKRRKMNSSAPHNDDAYLKAEALRSELHTWIRLVNEHRSIDLPATSDLITAGAWLARNVIALAMTAGSNNAYPAIMDRMRACEQIVDLPPDDLIRIDQARIDEANRQVVTAGQIEKIAGKLGHIGKGLNRRRVRTLDRAKAISPVSIDEGTSFYRLGDVLDAHTTHRARKDA